jgi:hypothetical protein
MKIGLAILAGIAIACLGAPRVAVAQSSPSIVPTVDCVRYDSDTRKLHVFFGYTSTHTVPVILPVSGVAPPWNFFFPDPVNRNQPTVFLPGTSALAFYSSFVVDPSGMQHLSWLLDGASVTATRDSTPCPIPFPLTTGPAGPAGPAGSQGPAGPPGAGLGAATRHDVTVVGTRTESATAACAAGETVMGGGGSCAATRVKASTPTTDGWTVTCGSRTTVTATAICARP